MRINGISGYKPISKTNTSFRGVAKTVTGKANKDGSCMVPSKLLEDNKQFIKMGNKTGKNIRNSESGMIADYSVYYAEPYEEITDEMLKNYSYVGVYASPMRLFKEQLSMCPTSKSLEGPINRLGIRMDYLTFMNNYAQQKIEEANNTTEEKQEELELWNQRAAEAENYINETSEYMDYVKTRQKELEAEEKLGNPQISPEEKRQILQAKIDKLTAQLEELS